MNTGLKKICRDLMLYKGRTVLTLMGILIGLVSVGAVFAAYATLNREMDANYMGTNPSSFVFEIENLDYQALAFLEESYSDFDVELRKTVQARISRGDGTYGTIYLKVVQDINNLKVDSFTLEEGYFPTTDSEMTIERDSLKILTNLESGVDERISIKFPGGIEKEMLLSGRVHAPGLPPASMENYSYAFLTLDGLRSLGYKGFYSELHIVSYDQRFNWDAMKKLSQEVKNTLIEKGYVVSRVEVPEPGKHPHASQLASLLFLLQTFAVISLLVACLIIINLLNFIMSKQIKQIAVMKAVGASSTAIAIPYFVYVLLISLVAIALSIPLAIFASRGYCSFAAGKLNFDILDASIPLWVFLVQILVGILIPIGSAAYPVYKSCMISVREGLSEKVSRASGRNMIQSKNSKINIPINNLLRKRTRTILATLALIAGGVLFMTSRNIVASLDKTTDVTFESFSWNYDIRINGHYPENQINDILNKIDGLDVKEIWKGSILLLEKEDGANSAYYQVRIIPNNSEIANFSNVEHLDDKGNNNAIILTNGLLEDEPWLKSGTKLQAKINGKSAEMFVTKVVNEIPPIPAVYIEADTFENLFGGSYKQMVLASTKAADYNEQRIILKAIEEEFKAAGVELSDNLNIYVLRKAFVDHLVVIISLLSVLAMLAVLVGGLSIGSAIGINVSERKREIGVLRVIGVQRYQMITMILFEVLIMGVVGWLVSMVISYPVSIWVGNYFGQIFLSANLENTLSFSGAFQWLTISIVVSMTAGLLPAWKAANSKLIEMLSYE